MIPKGFAIDASEFVLGFLCLVIANWRYGGLQALRSPRANKMYWLLTLMGGINLILGISGLRR